MARAMARGWARLADPPQMSFCDLDAARADALAAEVGGTTAPELRSLRDACDVLLLAVKPTVLDDVAGELEGRAPALLSVMAATTTQRLSEAFPGVPALRVMPNQPVEVGRGVICYAEPRAMEPGLARKLVSLLEGLGATFELPEDRLEAAMAIMSCAPAYAARFAGTLAAAGAREGLPADVALELVAATLDGTGALLGVHQPREIVQAVAPPGGATEAGLAALTAGGFDEAIAAAVDASLERFR